MQDVGALMLAHMNEEALNLTLRTARARNFSRAKGRRPEARSARAVKF